MPGGFRLREEPQRQHYPGKTFHWETGGRAEMGMWREGSRVGAAHRRSGGITDGVQARGTGSTHGVLPYCSWARDRDAKLTFLSLCE